MVISIILGAGVIKSEHDRQGHGTLNWQCPNNEFMIGAIFLYDDVRVSSRKLRQHPVLARKEFLKKRRRKTPPPTVQSLL